MLSNTKELMIWVYYTYNRWSEPHFFVSFPCCATTQIYILDNHLMDCSLPKSKSSWHENFTDRFHGTIVTWPCPRPRGIQTQVSQSHSSKMELLIFRLMFFFRLKKYTILTQVGSISVLYNCIFILYVRVKNHIPLHAITRWCSFCKRIVEYVSHLAVWSGSGSS